MRKFTTPLLFVLSLLTGCAALTPAHQANLDKAREMAEQMSPAFPNVSRVNLHVDKVEGFARSFSFKGTCHVTFDDGYLAAVPTQTELAFTLAHEIAHCEHGDAQHIVLVNLYDGHALKKEFAADRKAQQVLLQLKLGDVTTLTGSLRPIYLRDTIRATTTHPAGSSRFAALQQVKQ